MNAYFLSMSTWLFHSLLILLLKRHILSRFKSGEDLLGEKTDNVVPKRIRELIRRVSTASCIFVMGIMFGNLLADPSPYSTEQDDWSLSCFAIAAGMAIFLGGLYASLKYKVVFKYLS